MKRLLAVAALALGLGPSTGHALSEKSFDFCGGSYNSWTGFAFCASVNVKVVPAVAGTDAYGLTHSAGAYTITMDVVNKSGLNGSYANSLFIQMGLDHLPISPEVTFANPANVAIIQNGNLICKNVIDLLTGKANCYNVQEDKTAAGGIKVDFLSSASNGVSLYAIQSCASNTVPGLVTCPGPVRIQFDVTQNVDLTNVQYYVKAQGQLGSTECETGSNSISCVPTTSVPEPGTTTLLATGLAFVVWFGRRRRNAASVI